MRRALVLGVLLYDVAITPFLSYYARPRTSASGSEMKFADLVSADQFKVYVKLPKDTTPA